MAGFTADPLTATEVMPFASGVLNQNATFTQTFDKPGSYHYHCTIHPFMQGEVVVE